MTKMAMGCDILFLKSLVLFGLLVLDVSGFLPNRLSAISKDDFTQEDITEEGILRALFPTLQFRKSESFDEELQTYFADAGQRKLFENAVSDIVRGNNMVDVSNHDNPSWHFNDEKIMEGHELLVRLYDRLLATLGGVAPDVLVARETLGQCLHLLQSFYSNTNWVELGRADVYRALGKVGRPLAPVAPLDLDTCRACGVSLQVHCRDNILTTQFLTSGYRVEEDRLEVNDAGYADGKCRHGGKSDLTSGVSGGINKESRDEMYSPHYFLHDKAATLAIKHTAEFVVELRNDLARLDKEWTFKQLFNPGDGGTGNASVTVMLDLTSGDEARQTTNDVTQLLANNGVYVTKTVLFDSIKQVLRFIHDGGHVVVVTDQLHLTEEDPDVVSALEMKSGAGSSFYIIRLHDYTDSKQSEGNNERNRRATGGSMSLYNLIADTSGGTVFITDKTHIGAVVDIIKDSVSSSSTITVMKFSLSSNASDTVSIPVDDRITNVTIKIQGTRTPTLTLKRPDGSTETFAHGSTKQTLGTRLVVLKLVKPKTGLWKLQRSGGGNWDVDVTAKSDLDFTFQLLQPGPGGFGEYPLTGRPIAGANTTIQITVPQYSTVKSIDSVILLSREGSQKASVSLRNVGGRRGKSLFKGHIIVPTDVFKIAIKGLDKSGNEFRRLDPVIISTLGIKLEVLPLSGTLYINKDVTIPYRVTNVGGGSTAITVTITDDLSFAKPPLTYKHSLASHKSGTGKFTLHAGPTKGVTTTVTISAKADGAPSNKVQYSVQRITVEEKIVRVEDKTDPTCNVTNTFGKCDFGGDACACANLTWRMTAEIADVGFGLQSVFASGAGNSSQFTKDTFLPGDKGVHHAQLQADCCHQHAKITVVDLAGNVGQCDVVITPGFTPVDPKLCVKPSATLPTPTHNATRISCHVTNINGSCDLRSGNCTGTSCSGNTSCDQHSWEIDARLGMEGFGRYQAISLGAGKESNLTLNNHSVHLSTDCCHPSVFVNVIDIAGNLGQCHAEITVTSDPPDTSPNQQPNDSTPIGLLAGAAGGGAVVLGGAAVLAVFLKKKFGAPKSIAPDPDAVEG